jgi:Protein of unknown function (DUF3592)
MKRLRRIALVLFALGCLGLSLPDFAACWRISRWPIAPGRVLASDTRQEKDGERFRYFADIEIGFEVHGAPYTTRSIRADSGLSAGDRGWSDRIVGRYQRRSGVPVHYEPGHPENARVETSPQPSSWTLLVWGVTALFCAWWAKRP